MNNDKESPFYKRRHAAKINANTEKTTPLPVSKGEKHVRVKSAKGRKLSSTLWLQRQLNDIYVQEATRRGYKSRAAFKLLQINEKYSLFKPDDIIIDLGCAPGGWLQIAHEQTNHTGTIIGVDLLPVDQLDFAHVIVSDFTLTETENSLIDILQERRPNLVISDMAAATTGHQKTDHLRTIALAETAAQFALSHLQKGGHFVCKVFSGGTDVSLLHILKKNFKHVHHFKPDASRKNSPEIYVIALNFIGDKIR